MTGAYIRIKRDSKWQNIEVEHLTDDERKEALKEETNLMPWLNMVCGKLREVELLGEFLE